MIKNFTLNAASNLESLITKIRQLEPTRLWVVNIIEKKSKRSVEQNSRLWLLYKQLSFLGKINDR